MTYRAISHDAVTRRAFLAAYLVDFNLPRACAVAGIAPSAARLLISDDPSTRESIRMTETANLAIAGVNREDVLRHTAAMLYFDPRKILDENGSFIAPGEWPDEVALTIQGFEVTERTVTDKEGVSHTTKTYKVKMPDRQASAERLSKHLGLYAEDHAQQVDAVGAMLAAIHSTGSRLPLAGQVVDAEPLRLSDFRPDEHDYL